MHPRLAEMTDHLSERRFINPILAIHGRDYRNDYSVQFTGWHFSIPHASRCTGISVRQLLDLGDGY
jgi:hypothetical protein